MTKSIKLPDLIFLLPILVVLSVVVIVNLPFYQTAPASLTYAVTLDLLLTTPLIYFLIIRKKELNQIKSGRLNNAFSKSILHFFY